MYVDYVLLALKNLKTRKKRTLLTIIGIFIGIAAIVSLTSLGQGLDKAIGQQLTGLGVDKVIVQAKQATFSQPGSAGITKMTDHDIDVIKKVNNVEDVAGRIMKSATTEFNKVSGTTMLTSLPDDKSRDLVIEAMQLEASTGRVLKKNEKGKAMIGQSIATTAFKKPIIAGNIIKINKKDYEVVGIIKKTGNPGLDQIIILNQNDLKELLNIGNEESMIVAKVSGDPNQAADAIKRALRRDRNEKEGKEDFTVQTSQQMIDSFKTILNIVQAVIIGIAAISLIVGAVGILNTMYTSILERTREIGIMKAIGAKNKHILALFLTESAILGLIGGITGVLAGMGIGKLFEISATAVWGKTLIQTSFPPYLIIGAILFALIIGTISGYLPARQASKMHPVDALRFE